MRLSSEMLVEALRRYADDNDLTHVELGKRFGFNASKTGNVFSGRTRLSGDDVLRILEDPDFALPKLKKYIAYWRLRRDVTAVERDMRDSDTVSEDTLFSAKRIQGSVLTTTRRMPSSELARNIMSGYHWWALRTGWICSVATDKATATYTPIAPDLNTAVEAMKRMKWIYRSGDLSCVDWGKVTGGNVGQAAADHCATTLRDFILAPDTGFDVDEHFRQAAECTGMGSIRVNRVNELSELIDKVTAIAKDWIGYELPAEPDEYGYAPSTFYADKLDYLESLVLEACAIHDQLQEEGVPIGEDVKQAYDCIMSEDGSANRYAVYIAPILAVNDRRGKMATPSPEDRKRYNALRTGRRRVRRSDSV